MGPTKDGPCNVGAFLTPMPADNKDEGYLISIIIEAENDAGDIADINEYLPKPWDGKFVTRLYPVESLVADMRAEPETFAVSGNALEKYAEEGVTHLALLESNQRMDDAGSYYFGPNEIKYTGLLLSYCAERGVYRFLHCEGCATAYTQFIGAMQSKWAPVDADGKAVQAKGPTLN